MLRLIALLALAPLAATADEAVVEAVTLKATGDSYSVSVTLSHGDTGWEDYADGWRVEAEDGTILGERPLAHPHVNEQPFTRSTSGVKIPEGTRHVYIRARTLTEGWGDTRHRVAVP